MQKSGHLLPRGPHRGTFRRPRRPRNEPHNRRRHLRPREDACARKTSFPTLENLQFYVLARRWFSFRIACLLAIENFMRRLQIRIRPPVPGRPDEERWAMACPGFCATTHCVSHDVPDVVTHEQSGEHNPARVYRHFVSPGLVTAASGPNRIIEYWGNGRLYKKRHFGMEWCRRRGSNPHGLAATGF